MLRLTMQRESRWIEAAGARVRVRHLTTAIITAAKSEALKRVAAIQAEEEDKVAQGFAQPNVGAANIRAGLVEQFVAEALLRYAAEEWEGVCDETGAPLPLGDAAYDALAAHEPFAREFLNAAFKPLDALASEGNGSAPSSPGAGVGGATTAPDAAMADARPAPQS